jgi:hypothetical protein
MKKIFSLATWKIFVMMMLPYFMLNYDVAVVIVTIIITILVPIYVYNLGIEIYKKLPGGSRMSINKFKFHFIFPVVYMVGISIAVCTIPVPNGAYGILDGSTGLFFLLLFFIHLLAMYCVFYCMYFLARVLITVETQNKNIATSDYIGYLFAFWFLPIGIWFIQPKVRKLLGNETA